MSTDPKRWVAGHVSTLPRSGIRDFFELVAKMKGQDVISLGVGEPDFVTPWHVREAAIYALEKGKTYYTSNLGLIELRREISKYVEEHFGITYRPDDEVIVTVGVSEALDLTIRSFGVLRAADTPAIEVRVVQSAAAPLNGSDAVFAAVAAAAWRHDGFPARWPTMRA